MQVPKCALAHVNFQQTVLSMSKHVHVPRARARAQYNYMIPYCTYFTEAGGVNASTITPHPAAPLYSTIIRTLGGLPVAVYNTTLSTQI